MIRIGLDVGSTTLKCVALDESNEIIYNEYERHYSKIAEKTSKMLGILRDNFPGERFSLTVSGSAGMGIATALEIPFVQEVYATRIAVRSRIPDCDVVIELGGEDAKILFLGGSMEVRMNGSCAGGTGAFIDQMATLLDITPEEMNALAATHEKIYTIASRCGVFAKSDIQPLINQGASKSDVCASIFYAVVNQTIAGLAQGRELTGRVVYLGGPLTFLPQLRRSFDKTLDTEGLCPEHSLYFVALGAALTPQTKTYDSLDALISAIERYRGDGTYKFCPPLFASQEDYRAFSERHARAKIRVGAPVPETGEYPVWLGIDAGSTTVKAVAVDRNEEIVFDRYEPNSGNPVTIVRTILTDFYRAHPRAVVRAACVTGYGEEIIKNAFGLDFGVVETIAHYTAAAKFDPQVDFIIDIGGQDIKCFKIRGGVIDNIFLNEACSSGCGSFLQTFAGALGDPIAEFAKKGIFALRPVDLGSRCTVFMNSSVKQAQKDGASIDNISAGLSISVVKNAIYKVIRAASASELGEHIIVQGGTFYNDAVLRAFEQELGFDVVRPNIAGLMGAYGAALYAARRSGEHSTLLTRGQLDSFTHKTQVVNCGGCQNNCRLTVNTFSGGKKFISGNRCEKPLAKKEDTQQELNLYKYKRELLEGYMQPQEGTRGRVGLPMGLNMFELLPFWSTLLRRLGFTVVVSERSSRRLYLSGQHTIPSDTVCFPAKLMHGHIESLLAAGVDAIFYPCMSYNFDEHLGDNHYNCPVVAYYPEVLSANVGALSRVKFIYDYVDPTRRHDFAGKLSGILGKYFDPIPRAEVAAACDAAYAEYAAFLARVRRRGDEYLAAAQAGGRQVIVLCGRPYHLDEEVNHDIDALIAGMGAVIVTEDAVSDKVEKFPVRVLNQWTYHSRLYAAAKFVCDHRDDYHINLVQLVSFGCGVDAITTDETRRILEDGGKIYTQIKIDEITNLGAVRIRLRSLFAALEQQKNEKHETGGVR